MLNASLVVYWKQLAHEAPIRSIHAPLAQQLAQLLVEWHKAAGKAFSQRAAAGYLGRKANSDCDGPLRQPSYLPDRPPV